MTLDEVGSHKVIKLLGGWELDVRLNHRFGTVSRSGTYSIWLDDHDRHLLGVAFWGGVDPLIAQAVLYALRSATFEQLESYRGHFPEETLRADC